MIVTGASSVVAEKMTAGSILERMDNRQQVTFLAGVVEGMATARYHADDKAPEGRACIYNWFYETDGTMGKILAAFERYPDQLPGAVMAVLARGQCGG